MSHSRQRISQRRLMSLIVAAWIAGATVLTGCQSEHQASTGPVNDPAGKPLHAAANFHPSMAGFVACSSKILEGKVLHVKDGKPGRMVASIAVDHWVKPAAGPRHVQLNLVDVAKDGVYQRWTSGRQLRLAVSVDPTALPDWQFSSDAFQSVAHAVRAAQRLTCPYGPS